MNYKVTQCREKSNGTQTGTVTLVSMEKLINRIMTETKKEPVGRFRRFLRCSLPSERNSEADRLPKIIPAAQFVRTEGGMTMKQYNGIVELTVGPLAGNDEIELVKQRAWEMPQTCCIFTGSSGRSVKIWTLFTYPEGTLPATRREAEIFHAHAYQIAVKYYGPQLPFAIRMKEPTLEQWSRLSHDKGIRYRADALPFFLRQPSEMPDVPDYRTTVLARESPLTRMKPDGEMLQTTAFLFEAALQKALNDIQEANENCSTPTNNLHTLLTQVALRCFQSGLPQEETVKQIRSHFYTRSEERFIRQMVKNIYNEHNGFGKKDCLSKEQKLAFLMEEFMQRRYEFRFNTQMGEAEYRRRNSFCFKFVPVDKRVLNSIALDAQAEGIPLWDKDVVRYVYSDRIPKFDPLDDFLSCLPPWDGINRIGALARRVPCNNRYWEELFHRWFLNMVSHWSTTDKQYANSVSPLLVGAQGVRKSTFCRSLLPPALRSYYTDSLNFAQKKDAELALNRFALINIDEFDQISQKQQGFLKHILQKPVVTLRKPHSSAVLEMRRYASFIATSNQKALLTDTTGSRRFICIEVTGVIQMEQPIDYEQLYAQALHEIRHGERFWFNDMDERIMTMHNQEFEITTPEEQLFFRYFRPKEVDETGEWLAPTEIMNELRKYTACPLSTGRITYFGRILQKHKVPSKHTKGGTVYHVERRK